MKTRKEIPLREAVAVLDQRLERVRGYGVALRKNRAEFEGRGIYTRKLNELRLERVILEQVRNSIRALRYSEPGPLAAILAARQGRKV